ncbi:ATP-binding protein [Caldifermentibacillus hisashii]|uniref:ATP-binding protein n=1 Tax=Caldifermentibacillus hisashii TaxID=996558 RepID=UPI002E1EA85A|nr:ATP-binding protein [Caldifermentibacillus hisashii]
MTKNAIGIITKVFFNKIVIEVPNPNDIVHNFQGELYILNGLNDFVIINKDGASKYVYQIIGLYEQEKTLFEEEQSKFSEKAFFEAVPVGEIVLNKFKYGLATFPVIGEEVYLANNEEIETILMSADDDISIILGKLTTHNVMPKINLDSILTNHSCILGNTGSGKSTTVRTFLNEIANLKDHSNLDISKANFIIFDVHGEYTDLPSEMTTVVKVKDISIDLNNLVTEDWMNLLQPSTAAQRPILLNGLKLANIIDSDDESILWIKAYCALELFNNQSTDAVAKRAKIKGLLENIDSQEIEECLNHYSPQYGNFKPEYYDEKFRKEIKSYIEKSTGCKYEDCHAYLVSCLEDAECKVNSLNNLKLALDIVLLLEEAKGNNQIRTFCSTLMTRLDNLIATFANNLFSEDFTKKAELEDALQFEKTFTILDCSFIDDDVLLFFTSHILRRVFQNQYDEKMKNGSISKVYNFIFDEAHKYISESEKDSIVNYTKMFEIVAKEGRKFGTFLMLSSQRPSELSKTVISQCNNFILHRIRNNIDLEQMKRSIPYLNDAQINRLSYLKTGVALLVGESFSIPMEIKIDGEQYSEISKTYLPSQLWKREESVEVESNLETEYSTSAK